MQLEASIELKHSNQISPRNRETKETLSLSLSKKTIILFKILPSFYKNNHLDRVVSTETTNSTLHAFVNRISFIETKFSSMSH